MKWLILLALVACGKHQEPGALDLNDSDGDQVLNYQEGDAEKYIADFETLGNVKGRIKFVTDIQGEVNFSNNSYLLQDPMKIMIGDLEKKDLENYFTEWTELKLEITNDTKSPNQTNLLHLYFDHVDKEPTEVMLTDGKFKRTLGPWSPYMRVTLSKLEFDGLMKGGLRLSLRKNFNSTERFKTTADETIQNKTRKVFFSNGNKTQVLYVAKELPLEKLARYLEIENPKLITNNSLFFNSNDQGGNEWFYRKFQSGDLAIVKTSIQEIKSRFFGRFVKQGEQLKRENGSAVQDLKLYNEAGDLIYLKIRSSQTLRTFSESQRDVRYSVGSRAQGTDDSWVCTHFNRSVDVQTKVKPGVPDLINSLKDASQIKNLEYLEQIDEKGVFWEVKFTAMSSNLNLSLSDMPSQTYTVIGEYLVNCERGRVTRGGSAANVEEHLTFDVESFVEKMN